MYDGNPNLRGQFENVEYTQENIEEYIKCRNDFFYFCENYAFIISDGKRVPCILRDYQRDLVNSMHNDKMIIAMWPRRSGKSTVVSAYITWLTLFNDNHNTLIAAHEHKTAKEIAGMVKGIIENLPLWLQQGVVKWNELYIELENGSRVFSSATTKSTGRGFAFHFCVAGETQITVKNKKTGEVKLFSIEDFTCLISKENKETIEKNVQKIVKNENYEILTPHGWCDFDGIFISKSRILELTFDMNKKMRVSETHKFLCMDDKWRDANEIFHLDLRLKTGEHINSITLTSEETVYDPINVKNLDHSYYSDGIISHNCLLDEYSFVSPNVAKDFYTSIYPTIKGLSNGRMAIISTPSGYNFFYEMCEKAKAGLSNFKYSEIKWTDVPGRDEKFRKETIADIGEARFQQEFECVRDSTLINIRNKETGVISSVTIREFIEMCKS